MIRTMPIFKTSRARLTYFIERHAATGTKIYTDDNAACRNLLNHEAVDYSTGEYVRGWVHINGMESFWALLRRGYDGAFHHLSKKRLHRYANKFTGRLHARVLDMMVRSVVGKRLTYSQLVQIYLYIPTVCYT